MQLEMLSNYIALKETKETKSAGGIYIAGSTGNYTGEVVAVGPGQLSETLNKMIEPDVKIGDKVRFWGNNSKTITHEGQDLIIVREIDIFAKLTNTNEVSKPKE